MSGSPQEMIEKLEELRGKWWLYSTLCNIAGAILAVLLVLALLIALDVLLNLPKLLLQLLFLAWSGGSLALLATVALRAIRSQRDLFATARRVEMAFPALRNNLISLVQFAGQDENAVSDFQRASMNEAASSAGDCPLQETTRRYTRLSRWRLALQTRRDLAEIVAIMILLAGGLFLLEMSSPTWSNSSQRLFSSWRTTARADLPHSTPAARLVSPRLCPLSQKGLPDGRQLRSHNSRQPAA